MSDISLINVSIAKHFEGKVVYERNSAGVFSLIGALEAASLVVFFNEHFLDHRCSFDEEWERFLPLIENDSPVIGIGCHSIHVPFVVMLSQRIKKRFPEKTVVLGGIGPSSVAVGLMHAFDCLDVVIIGEGEKTLLDVLQKDKSSWHEIDGMVYRINGDICHNNVREPITDLDAMALPAYHAVDFSQYDVPTVITSRGCPHACPFCCLCTFWNNSVAYRSVDNVIQELKLLANEYGVKYVFFGDPSFNLDRQRVVDICEAIKKEKLNIHWECLVRADLMDAELMEKMREAGCDAVFYGLESGSESVHKRVKQNMTVKQTISVIEQSAKVFKTVEVGLMWGFPFETLEDFKETLRVRDYLEKESKCEVQMRWLEPYANTALFEEYQDTLFIPDEHSLMYKKTIVEDRIAQGRDFYPDENELAGIKITADITNVRFIIAGSHVLTLCREIIMKHPTLFPDFYRFQTPALSEKLELAQEYSVY